MIIRKEQKNRLSQISVAGSLVHSSGLVQADQDGITGQTRAVLSLVDKLLLSEGISKSNILHCLIHLADMSDFASMNKVYDEWLDQNSIPSRTCVAATLPNPNALIEITFTAIK